MRALCWFGPGDVRVERVADPEILNPHDAIVRVTLTAICGTDLQLFRGAIAGLRRGDILGHELIGEVVDVGPAVRRVRPGDRVAAACVVACGRCWFCREGMTAACDNTSPAASAAALATSHGHAGAGVLGVARASGGYAGGQAELIRVAFADVNCVGFDPALPDEAAILITDLLPTAWMAAERCAIRGGDVVAVFGCGPVGQLAIVAAYHHGADRVIAIDDVPERLAMAAELGRAEIIDDSVQDAQEVLCERTGGRGPDACIDAVGLEAHGHGVVGAADRVEPRVRANPDRATALRAAVKACRKGGTVSGVAVDDLPIGAAFGKALTVVTGPVHVHRYMAPLARRIAAGDLDPTYVITHRMALAEAPAAYRMLHAAGDGCVKVVMTP
jgi:threonine dehydrogenase-like Zn-dependent dehydrogenase